MENLDGSLGFKATLDIDDFNVSSDAIEKRIKKITTDVKSESGKMDDSILSFARNGAKYIVSYLVGQGMGTLLNSIVQVRGQFQQLEIAFETMLGSSAKAKNLMNQLVDTAAKTPFDLLGVASSAKQLLAYGVAAEDVNDTLIRLGNIASGLSIPLQDIAYLYGTTMTQGRLYAQDLNQFTGRGIPMVKELAKILGVAENQVKAFVSEGKVGFPEVQKVIQNLTNEGGMFFNLMEKQSESLTGMIANLGDAWDSALNKLGEDNQDVFSTAISSATYLVEHLEDILRIVKAITIAYGSYKAAIVLNTLATKGYTGVALLDNTARQAKIALLKLETVATKGVTVATKALWTTIKTNPIGWFISLLGAVISIFTLFGKKEKEITEEQVGLANSTKRAGEEFAKQASKIDALQKILNDANHTYSERIKALKEIQKIIPGYNAELTNEGKIINDNTKAIQNYLSTLEKQIKLKAAQEELEAAYREKRLKEKEIIQKESAYNEAHSQVPDVVYGGDAGTQYQLYALRQAAKAERQLKQARKELIGINSTIDDLNSEINATSLALEDSTSTAKTYTEQMQETKDKISSLTKELELLRSGKVSKNDLASEIESKVSELNAAKRNLELLTGEKNSTASTSEQYNQKRLESDFKLEKDRISVMEDGYAKRKALLDLQHKQNLSQIAKEEKDLLEARKKAGKGGLSQTEIGGFEERRNIEKSNYNKTTVELFDDEITYRKQQYALYFRWVENMGEDVANTQFATLLKGGKSYKEYVENEIKALKDKQQAGTLTEGESNQLISLNMQYNEITGAKSAMDSFKESVSKTIQQAQTLAEKLEAIADAKEKLANGSSGLVGADEKAEATLFVSEEDEKLQEEVQQKILSSYRTFEEQRNDIQKEYALLRAAAQKTGDQERINQVNKSEAEALSTLTANMLKQSDSWKKLFGDLDSLSVAEIDKLVADIETKLKDADLKLNPVDYRALIDSLNQAKETLISKNPFKALGTFYDDYIEAKKKLAEAKANVAAGKGTDEDVKKAEADMKKAAKGVTKSIETITDTATTCGNAIASMFSDLGQDDLANGLGTAMELFGQLGNAAASVGKMMSGDILGGVTGMVSAVTSVVGIFAKLHDSKYEKKIQNLQKEIDALEQSYSRLERAYNNTYWVFNDSQREAYEKNIQLINDQIRALEQEANVAKKNWDFARYAQLNKEIKELNKQLKNAEENGDMFSIYEAQKKNLKQQQEDLRKQIQAEKDKKKTDNGKIQQWNEQIESITQQIEDLDRSMMETLAGTDVKTAIDEFADALVDAYCKGEDAAEALGEKTKEVLKKAVVEALKREFLAKGINDAVLYLGESMKDGKLTDVEKREFERMVNAAGDLFNSALEGIGDWIKDVEEETVQQDPLTGAVTSMNEETGGVIAGRLNAFVINQSDQTSIMRQALVYQAEIAANTKLSASELTEIKTTLKRIENKDSSLLSQGIA